jgi:bacteriocin biosynthesis cyclodehydratase domain-containing protein
VATALRMRDAGPGIGGSYVGFGPFGSRAAALLSAQDPRARIVNSDAATEAFAHEPSVVVAAFWRPSPAVCEQFDELAYARGIPWLPIIVEHPVIRIGPLVEPPSGVCFRCYRRRCAQHDAQRRTTAALHEAYDRDPGVGPAGYLPHHARLVAHIAGELLRRRRAHGAARAAEVVTVQLFGQDVQASPVMAFGDCDRCRGAEGAGDSITPVLRSIGRCSPENQRTHDDAF